MSQSVDALIVGLHSLNITDTSGKDSWVGIPKYLKEEDIVNQLHAALEHASSIGCNLVILSGGATRQQYPGVTEAESCLRFLKKNSKIKFRGPQEAQSKETPSLAVVPERFARDTAENLFFGICCAAQFLGHLPNHVALQTFGVKEERMSGVEKAMKYSTQGYEYTFVPITNYSQDPNQKNESGESWADREKRNCEDSIGDELLRLSASFIQKRIERTPQYSPGGVALVPEGSYFDWVAESYPIAVTVIEEWKNWASGKKELTWGSVM